MAGGEFHHSMAVPFTQPCKRKHEACPAGAEAKNRAPVGGISADVEPVIPLPRQKERDD